MFVWEYRRLFNDVILEEIQRDFQNFEIRNVLDIGCGDGYLLHLLAEAYPKLNAIYCFEKSYVEITDENSPKIKHFDFKSYKDYRDFFDVITLIDVLYLMNKEEVDSLVEKMSFILSRTGIVYVMLGIYKESRGIELFSSQIELLKDKYSVTIYSLDEICSIFSRKFKVFLKKINLVSYFGIMPPKFKDVKRFIDYLYEDKIIIKLILK